jgi:hypothetical protein
MAILDKRIHVPSDVLEALGAYTVISGRMLWPNFPGKATGRDHAPIR